MQVVIYHNPACSKSRQTLDILQNKGIIPEIVEYLTAPPDENTLRHIVKLLGITPRELLRTGEEEYLKLQLNEDNKTDDALVHAMATYPCLIERPIVVVDNQRARIGRPPESVLVLFE